MVQVSLSSTSWLLTTLYASRNMSIRRVLRDNLSLLATPTLSWVAIWDFNDVMHTFEKFRGAPASISRMQEFHACLNDCNLFDLGFEVPSLYGQTNILMEF